MKSNKRLFITAVLVALTMGFGTVKAEAEEIFLKAQTNAVGTFEHLILTSFTSIAQKEIDQLKIQVTAGLPSTRSHVALGRNEIQLTQVAPSIMFWMQEQIKMYSDLADAPELQDNLRTIFNCKLGANQWVTFANSGIESLADLRGKKLFAGPAASAAADIAVLVIEAETGMKAGEDYKLVNLDWPSGPAALQDGQIDVFMRPTSLPSADIQQIATLRPIRFLGYSEATINHPIMRDDVLFTPGVAATEIPPDVYGDRQVNTTPIIASALWAGVRVNVSVDEDLVYKMTKAWWENLDDFAAANPGTIASLGLENLFAEAFSPYHAGALRYYREIGIEIPDRVLALKP